MKPSSEIHSPTTAAPGHRQASVSLLLYLLWVLLALGAHRAGLAVLEPAGGLLLLTGITLTAGLFLVLDRLSLADQPSPAALVTAQALMGIVWTTLYGHFAQGGLVLAGGMYATAILYALPVVSGPALFSLALAAAAAAGANVLLGTGAGMPGSLGPALAGLGSLAVVLGVAVATGWRLAAERAAQEHRYDELRQGMDRLTRRADKDHLTHSYTRRFIVELLGREKARSDRNGEAFCVLLLDIDHFKSMNDRHGHLGGDRILASFARRVRAELRDMDSVNRQGTGQPALGRYGGEEFIVILPHTGARGALRAAERIRKAVVRQPFEGSERMTVSIGIAEYRAAESVSDLLARADGALYGAKNAGRNRVHCAAREGGGSVVVMPEIPRAS